MTKIILLTLVLSAFTSCKNNSKTEKTANQYEELTLLKGNFIYYTNAAVLQTKNEVYGVIIDPKMHELDKQAKQYKKEATDMVPVEIRGIIIPKPENEEGWDLNIEIKEILKVSKPRPEDSTVITIGEE